MLTLRRPAAILSGTSLNGGEREIRIDSVFPPVLGFPPAGGYSTQLCLVGQNLSTYEYDLIGDERVIVNNESVTQPGVNCPEGVNGVDVTVFVGGALAPNPEESETLSTDMNFGLRAVINTDELASLAAAFSLTDVRFDSIEPVHTRPITSP